jgi:hypothetical protein
MDLSGHPTLLILGLLFLLGLAADLIGRHTFLPRVTLMTIAEPAVDLAVFPLRRLSPSQPA